MTTPEKWVAGTLPKRGVAARPRAPVHGAKLVERVARSHSRSLAGRPLAVALDACGQTRGQRAGHAWGTLALILGLVAGILGLVLGSLLYLIPGGALVGLGAYLFWRGGRRTDEGSAFLAEIGRDAAALDSYLETILPDLPQSAVGALSRIKELLAEVVLPMGDRERAAAIPSEEQFFVRELISRYLRDACDRYLAVIRANASVGSVEQTADERSPEDSLLAQIEILAGRLQKVLVLVAASEREKLARHEAFIATKR